MRSKKIRIEGDVAYIPLTKGYEAVIDANCISLVSKYTWQACVRGRIVYARRTDRSSGSSRTITMHREIANVGDGFQVDHIDGNGVNNRMSNLRKATHAENCRNRRIGRNNSSGIKGVMFVKSDNKFRAEIRVNGKQMHLGMYDTKEEAYARYCKASKELHKEFSNT